MKQQANSTNDERDRNYGCKMEKVSLLSSDCYLVSKSSHTMRLLFCETSTRRRLIFEPPSLFIFPVPVFYFIVHSFKTTDRCLYQAVCFCHECYYIWDTLRLINKFTSAYTVHFIPEKCVKDVQTFCTSSTIAKMHLYIADSKKLTV